MFSGTITVNASGLGGRTYLSGTTASKLTWPTSILPPTYTLFHVAKYNNGVKGRILNGINLNWLSGFYAGASGVAYHNGWLTSYTVDCCGYNWVLSTDQNSLYRANRVQKSTSGGGAASAILGINQNGDQSDWAVAAVIVFNRTLTSDEYNSVENWLSVACSLTATITPPPVPPPVRPCLLLLSPSHGPLPGHSCRPLAYHFYPAKRTI